MAENNLEYAFTWLTSDEGNKIFDLIKAQVQAANPIFGEIKFEIYDCTKGAMPQKYQSAWTGVKELVGAGYRALLTVGQQQAKGTNYWFIAEQTLSTKPSEKHIVTLAINEFAGNYETVNGSIVKIF